LGRAYELDSRSHHGSYPNLTIKKIPKTVLSRCEWGRDDYSLDVANLKPAPPPPGQQGLGFED
jgi:adenine-specific DNA-methyltransferase